MILHYIFEVMVTCSIKNTFNLLLGSSLLSLSNCVMEIRRYGDAWVAGGGARFTRRSVDRLPLMCRKVLPQLLHAKYFGPFYMQQRF